MNPILAVELLFFAIFGQTTHEHFKRETMQPEWTTVLFKLTFGIYMLVSVVVLINLLIAMMSDTYQRIQAQSDIEWKYGLSKLVRNMHRTTTAPSPLNLLSTWITYFIKLCKKRLTKKKERPSLMHLMGATRMSPRTRMGAKWLSKIKKTSQVGHKENVALSVAHLSPLGSQLSFRNIVKIDNVVDWEVVRRKYRDLYGEKIEEKPIEKSKESTENPLAALESSSDAAEKIKAWTWSLNEEEMLLKTSINTLLKVNPVEITENLFFAIFGQKGTEDFSLNKNNQPQWTANFFKVSFSLYMLVSVIVLINLLIAMMSDTYHKIQSQSDIEWKYGLSKLVRKMQKAKTAPSPLNLVTTWAEYLKNACMKERIAKQKIGRSRGYMEPDMQRTFSNFSVNTRMLPLPRAAKERINFSLLQSSTTISQTSLNNIPKIQNIVDWDIVRRKYRMRFGDEIEKPSSGEVTLAEMA